MNGNYAIRDGFGVHADCFQNFKGEHLMSMQARIALIAQPSPKLQLVKAQLRNPLRYSVREFLSLEAVVRELGAYQFDILVMRVPNFVSAHVQMLEKVRRRFSAEGLLTTSPLIEPGARFQSRRISNHKLIHEPTELEDLGQLIDKMKKGEPSALRLHARSRRDDLAELVDQQGRRLQGRFLDIAQMGARIVVRSRERLMRNTRVQLHYASTSEPGRTHRIEAIVVWENLAGGMVETLMNGPNQILGLRFIAAL
jgi:hypothetical protein